MLCCALFLAVIQAPPASRVGAGNMIMEASVEMEKIEPGVVVAQQPVVARDPGEALRRGDIGGYLGDGVVLRQQTSQCCRVLCCQPNIDWVCTPWTPEIDTLGKFGGAGAGSTVEGSAPLAYVSEDAPWGGRCYSCLAPGSRPTTLTYHAGPDASGQILFKHRKGCTNGQNQWIAQGDGGPVRVPCCCFLPYLDTLDAHDQKLGRSEYVCDACLFVPKYRVLGPAGEAWYAVRPDTCACGMCVECRCGGRGAKCCRVPFYVRHPETRAKLDGGNAVFVDLWAGWAAEMCTRRDLYEMKFPAGATSAQKCTLLGCAHLIDLTVKEQEGN